MKNILFLCLLIGLSSCEPSGEVLLTKAGDLPFSNEREYTLRTIATQHGYNIVQVYLKNNRDANFYVTPVSNLIERQFLTNIMAWDGDEDLLQAIWGGTAQKPAFAFYFGNSSRFKTKTRLCVYIFENGVATEVLDAKNEFEISEFRFTTPSQLSYTKSDGSVAYLNF
jgi:hypothetical protein